MLLTDNDFLRLERNYITAHHAASHDVSERRRALLRIFTESSSSGTSGVLGSLPAPLTTSESDSNQRRTFIKPVAASSFSVDFEYASFSGCPPRRYLRLPPHSILGAVFKDAVLPSGASWIPLVSKVASSTVSSLPPTAAASSTATVLPRATKRSRSEASGTSTPMLQNAGSPKSAETNAIRQIVFSDATGGRNSPTTTTGTLLNADWTCDGKFIVVCGKHGLLLGDVKSATYVASAAGDFSRVACHPSLPTIFAALLHSSSLVIFEIGERPALKTGRSSFVMKITAEMKFTSVKLSSNVLVWSPLGEWLTICNNDRGLYLLAFEDLTPSKSGSGSSTTEAAQTSLAAIVAAFQLAAGRPQRIRRTLRIVSQRKCDTKIVAASFANDGARINYDTFHPFMQSQDAQRAVDHDADANLVVYVLLESGQLMVYPIDRSSNTVISDGKRARSTASRGAVTLAHTPTSLPAGFEVAAFDTDPCLGRFLVSGGVDDSLVLTDTACGVIVGTHYRVGAPVSQVAVSGGGAFVAWAPQLFGYSSSSSRGGNEWLDQSRGSQTRPYVALSSIGSSLDFLWKTDFPATVVSLRWHPWLPALLVVYDSESVPSSTSLLNDNHGYHSSAGSSSTWEGQGSSSVSQQSVGCQGGTGQPILSSTQGVIILQFQ